MKQAACVVLAALVLSLVRGAELLESQKPKLKDWWDAEWFDNLVKIPLLIDERSLWYANLIPVENNGGYCMIDNNSAYTLIMPSYG